MARNRSRKRSSSSSISVLWWVVGGLVALMFVLIAAVGLVYFTMYAGGGKPLFDTGNANVSNAGFQKIEDGMSRAELEELLGPSYLPDEKDFARVTTDKKIIFQRHLFLAWSRGDVRILVQFDQPPNQGGLSFNRVLVDSDGSVKMIYGDANGLMQKKLGRLLPGMGGPAVRPPGADKTSAALLHSEFVEGSMIAEAKYKDQEVTVSGVIKSKMLVVVTVYGSTPGGTVTAMFQHEAGPVLNNYKVGDTIKLKGKIHGYTQANEGLTLYLCKIVNNP
jgi:hypothetical protein